MRDLLDDRIDRGVRRNMDRQQAIEIGERKGELRDALEALERDIQRVAQQFADENGPGLAFGIGVHMGEALVGYFGTAATRTYTAIGEATAVADQIQAHAAPGEVLISGELYAALQGRAEVEALGTQEVKGRAEPVQVLRLLALS